LQAGLQALPDKEINQIGGTNKKGASEDAP
jgi:hypothetical protein